MLRSTRMDRTSKLLLAAGLVTFAGATTGAAIGGTDMLDRSGIGGGIPAPLHEASSSTVQIDPSLPSHYAIETPEGRFEVAELRSRGLYRRQTASWYDRALAEDIAEQERALMEAELASAAYVPDPRFADAQWSRAGGAPTKAERLAARPDDQRMPQTDGASSLQSVAAYRPSGDTSGQGDPAGSKPAEEQAIPDNPAG